MVLPWDWGHVLQSASRIQAEVSAGGDMYRSSRAPSQLSGKQMQWELLTRNPPGNAANSAVVWMKAVLHSLFA